MDLPPPLPSPDVAYAPAAPADPNAVVDSDFPCRKCSYNLRGLTYGGRCPECGTPVGLSTVGDLLRYSDPNWLAKLGRGIRIMLWGIGIALIQIIVLIFNGPNSPIVVWISVAASLVWLFGSWLMTEPDPSGLGEDQYATSRRLVRASLLVTLTAELIDAMARTINPPPLIAIAVEMIRNGSNLFGAIGEFSMFFYLRKLSLRIPNERFAGRANFLAWAQGSTLMALAIVSTVLLSIRRFGFGESVALNTAYGVSGCFLVIILLARTVFGIMKIVFLYSLWRTLQGQAEMSRRIWKVMQQ